MWSLVRLMAAPSARPSSDVLSLVFLSLGRSVYVVRVGCEHTTATGTTLPTLAAKPLRANAPRLVFLPVVLSPPSMGMGQGRSGELVMEMDARQ